MVSGWVDADEGAMGSGWEWGEEWVGAAANNNVFGRVLKMKRLCMPMNTVKGNTHIPSSPHQVQSGN